MIETLVVAAIIAILLALLVPALARTREMGRRSVCLSNRRQQGVGFSSYSADFRNVLPVAGSFRWSLMEGTYYTNYLMDSEGRNWVHVNHGALFPRYIGNNGEVYYCPSNTKINKQDPENGLAALWQRYRHPRYYLPNGSIDPEQYNAHNFPWSPLSAYGYALPAAVGRFPKDEGVKIYPQDVIQTNYGWETSFDPAVPATGSFYWRYIHDPWEPDPSFLGPWPPSRRGKHAWPALLADAYFGDWTEGYHMGGYDVLYCDLHARWIRDPHGRIHAARLPDPRRDYASARTYAYIVWEYFSQHP